ncbi:MAG: S-adenosylmethionine decarboxylase related protein [Candidatus Pristimantibacillus sp.]
MEQHELNMSIFGSSGGVAKAVLSILNKAITDKNDPLYARLNKSKLHLVDWKQQDMDYYRGFCPHLVDKFFLSQLDLSNLDAVKEHLMRTTTTLVVDVSWADTVEMLAICDELAISYVNTAFEITSVDNNDQLEGFTLLERYRIVEEHRSRFTRVKGILCSGMNPGVVQWMAITLMNETPDQLPLGCYIVETDNTFYKDKSLLANNTIYASWSPECFLDEAIYNYPMLVQHHVPLIMYNQVYELEFKVTLGQLQFHGCLMPHEEVLTMGQLYDMELGFIYKVSDYVSNQIQANLDQKEELWNWQQKVFNPLEAELVGQDLVGVLLVYPDKERYIYNAMDNAATFAQYQTNATYFQVACGVYGGVCSLLLDVVNPGVHYVDELLMTSPINYGNYVSYYMKDFVKGENAVSEGLLLNRMRKR